MSRGVLEVHVLSANDITDAQWVGKQDPYCKLQLGNQSYRTTTATDGGTKPVWNQRFQFQVGAQHRELVAAIWNSNSLSQNDCLGSVRIPLVKVLNEGHDNSPQPIISPKGRAAGELRLMMIFTADANAPQQQPRMPQPQQVAPQQRMPAPAPQPRMPAPMPVQQPQQVYQQPQQVYQQPQVVVQQPQPQVVYAQPRPQVVYAQPQVMVQPQVASYYPAAPVQTVYRYM